MFNKSNIIKSLKKLTFISLIFVLSTFNFLSAKEKDPASIKKPRRSTVDSLQVEQYLILANNSLETNSKLALDYALKADNVATKSNLKKHKVYHTLSDLYFTFGNYKKSTYYSFLLLKESKKLKGDIRHDYEGRAYEKLSAVNEKNGDLNLAINYQKKAIELYKKIKNDNYYIIAYINLANYHLDQNNTESALKYYWFVESKLKSENLEKYESYVYNGLAVCYDYQDKIEKSLEYYEKSKNAILKYNPNDISSLAVAYNNIGTIKNENEEYLSSIENLEESLKLFLKLDDRKSTLDVYYNLALSNKNAKKFRESNEYLWKHISLKDSIFDDETKQMIHDLSIKYQAERKEQENKILAKENEKKQISIYYSLAGIILTIIILIVIFRSNRIKEKANKKLEEKKQIIEDYSHTLEKQHALLEVKTREITDSIRYAERIQGAILPPEQKWNHILPNSFIFYQPKDILSGDFYWIAEVGSNVFIAAADCTGHGVPGALISIVNFNLLNKAVLEKGLLEPKEILDSVNIWLTETLNQKDSESIIKDGMDISFISIDKVSGKCTFAGANNPIYHFSGSEMYELKENRFPVGGYIHEEIQPFTSQEIQLKPGDTIYLFSDGFPDQFGGEKGKKYKYRAFKETLSKAKNFPISQQKVFLNQTYHTWKGDHEQTDDILIIGIQF
jgi:serine phosphatase RsbU (regulator of sigma subunit)